MEKSHYHQAIPSASVRRTASLTSTVQVAPSIPSTQVAPSIPSIQVAPSVPSTQVAPSVPSTQVAPSIQSTQVAPSAPSAPTDPTERLNKIDKLVFSGGGLRGCIHIGVLKYLEQHHLMGQITCVGGTSIGSLIATLIAMSYSSDQLEAVIIDFDYAKFQSIDLCHVLDHFGFDTFEKINQYIASLFAQKDYPSSITFIDLYNKTGKHLVMNAVCLNTHENTFFDHLLTPHMPVIIAIQASMSLPFIFGSVTYDGLTYVDGGLLDNFPIDFPIFTRNPETVLGINLDNKIDYSVREINSLDQYCIHLFSCLYNTYIKVSTCDNLIANVINISTPKYVTIDLMLTTEEKSQLIALGYRKINDFFGI